jgi:hypothetical protein
MKTEKLTKTNLIPLEKAAEIEAVLGKEIEDVITYKTGHKRGFDEISPYTFGYYTKNLCKRDFKFGFYAVESAVFDKESITITVVGRKRWQRNFSTLVFRGEKIGYKLPTSKMPEGFIYGNWTKL